MRGLLRATQMVSGDLGLPVVLQRIVEAARDLVGARYAALGMIAPDGRLAEFVHIGMPEQAVKAIGHLPQGKGTIGGADRRSAADPAAPDQRGPALVGVPAGAPADDQLPRGADPGP